MGPTALLRRLSSLASEAHDNLYERLDVSSQLLRNTRWLQQQFANDLSVATTHLQQNYFRELQGYVSLEKMLRIFTTYSRPQWEMYNFDLRAMELLYDQPQLLTVPATATDAESARRRVVEMSYYVRYADEALTPGQELARLQRRLAVVETERQQLRERIQELRRGQPDAAA